MEKFGIFELLDTLSAIMAPNPAEDEGKAGEKPQTASPRTGAESRTESAEIITPKQSDSAFAPPAFGGEESQEAAANRNALGAFLDRHEKISKKIDGK